MTASGTAPRDYGAGARLFHWVTAVLVAVQVAAGVAMTTEAIAALNDTLFILHKGMGCVFLPLMGLRLAWKLRHPVAALPPDAPAPQRRLAALTHNALYALLFILPISGYVRTVGDGYPIEMLDALGIPPLVSGIPEIAQVMMVVHAAAAYGLVALVAVHLAASVHHGLGRTDGVLARIWPVVPAGGKTPRRSAPGQTPA